MVFKSVKEVIESTDLNAVFSFVNRGLWFTPLTEDEDGTPNKPEALGVKTFTKTIKVPAEIYRKPDQLEQYKSNLYFGLAKQLIDALFSETSTAESGIISIPSVAGVKNVSADPLEAHDLVLRASYINGGIYFNSAHAATAGLSTKTHGTVFNKFVNIDSSQILAFGIADGSYSLWLQEDIEEHFEISENQHYFTATIFVQGKPTLAPAVVNKA
ncbi:hypothetical protein [Paraglaciecola chathamensis]|uniref:hypothetical protein n=1 Tax=Paraglaciecola chathamensis TaxID=368405 RepID=UPI00362A4FA9